MAQRRMFNKAVTNNDNFLEMPASSQNLYFHLSMNADDDGFIDNWKSIIRMIGAKEDDLKILITKQFILPFELFTKRQIKSDDLSRRIIKIKH